MPGLRYSQAIVNAGREAGASIEHPHGQLLGMSFVPRELAEEQAGFARFAGRCLLCTTVDAEEDAGYRVVYADERVLVVCPFWSGTPYEMLVIPRTHGPHLHRASPADLVAVGRSLRTVPRPSSRERLRRRRLQPRLPLRPLPGARALPLARPRLAQAHHPGRASRWAPGSSSTSSPPSRPTEELRVAVPAAPEPPARRPLSRRNTPGHVAVEGQVERLRLRPRPSARGTRTIWPACRATIVPEGAVVDGRHGGHAEAGGEHPVEGRRACRPAGCGRGW